MSEVTTERTSFTEYKWDTGVFTWDDDIAEGTWDEVGISAFAITAAEDALFICDAIGKAIEKHRSNTLCLTEASHRETVKGIVSALIFAEVFYKQFDCGLKIEEAIIIAEVLNKAIGICKTGDIYIEDKEVSEFGKNTSEAIPLTESFARKASYYLYIDEVQQIVDDLAKQYDLPKREALSLVDEYYRASGAVIEAISFYDKELTLREFQEKDVPEGYGAFKEFIAGDLLYKDAIFKTVFSGTSTDSTPCLTEWKLNIDVADVFDKGTVDLVAEELHRVDFNRKFWETPDVTIKIRGSSDSSARIENLVTDTEGFAFELLNGENEPVDGVIYWKAEGY